MESDLQARIMSDSFLSSGAKVTALWLLKHFGTLESARGEYQAVPEELDINPQTFRKHLRELIWRKYREAK